MKDATLFLCIAANRHLVGSIMLLALAVSPPSTTFGGSATWNLNPPSGDWNTAAIGRRRLCLTHRTTLQHSASQIDQCFNVAIYGGK
jgi:hypothetical protein